MNKRPNVFPLAGVASLLVAGVLGVMSSSTALAEPLLAQANNTAGQAPRLMIYPDIPGASQSCVVPSYMKWTPGTPLVLTNCPKGGSASFIRSNNTIAVAGQPGLCVGVARGAQRPVIALQKCSEASTTWTSRASSTASARVESKDGRCWIIPKLPANANFPFRSRRRGATTRRIRRSASSSKRASTLPTMGDRRW